MVAFSRTFVGPQAFFGHTAVTFVPRFVPRSRTRTAGQRPAIAIVDVPPSTISASGTVAARPARSGGAPEGVTKRPSRHTGGFETRPDDAPESTSRATAATTCNPAPRRAPSRRALIPVDPARTHHAEARATFTRTGRPALSRVRRGL